MWRSDETDESRVQGGFLGAWHPSLSRVFKRRLSAILVASRAYELQAPASESTRTQLVQALLPFLRKRQDGLADESFAPLTDCSASGCKEPRNSPFLRRWIRGGTDSGSPPSRRQRLCGRADFSSCGRAENTQACRWMETQVIGFGLQKGGANKTTVATNVAHALARLGNRVLLIDVDANYGATNALLGPDFHEEDHPGAFELMTGKGDPSRLVLRGGENGIRLPDGVDFISADRRLETLPRILWEREIAEHRVLPLKQLREIGYDYILLDTGPSVSPGTKSAYCEADWFVIVSEAQPLCEVPITNTLTDLRQAQRGPNPNLKLAGIVLSSVAERTVVQREFLQPIRERFQSSGEREPGFAIISAATVVQRAQAEQRTVLEFAPRSKVARQFENLAARLHARIQSQLEEERHERRYAQAV